MEPGARPSGSGRGGNGAEEGGARGTPAPRRTRTWSRDGSRLGTPSGRPRPAASLPEPLSARGGQLSTPGAAAGTVRWVAASGAQVAPRRRTSDARTFVLPASSARPAGRGQLPGSEGSGAGFRGWSP
ncbi:unnamed protein product [Rangifer tarandus platyrhynchus]|uniref:Uncharacterized protein n=2 Tax=Rangifer tarandus platyrhynchus TaxID=3082113 RepID=A0ABN8YSQ6_RANTA|nr:unnamed protein product [Rangifer tarandus platyrhynchus]CAI9702159.1 unnamed protein product [Rangifer tarandus platyrhynchus]